MPYGKLADLPDAVKGLPKHGQEVWQAAFNAAFKEYGDDEAKCAATAWAAVESAGYEKDGDKWRRVKETAIADAITRLRPVDPKQFKLYAVGESAVTMLDDKGQIGVLPYAEVNGGFSFGQFVYPPIMDGSPTWEKFLSNNRQDYKVVGGNTVAETAPGPVRETFTAKESEAMAFTASEGVLIGGQSYHANPTTGEYPVFIIAEGHNKAKRRQYTAGALDKVQEGFYDGMPMHLDHAGKEGDLSVRSVRDFVGKVVKSGRAVLHEGVRKIPAVVKFFDGWTREHMADPDWRSGVGLSHVADVSGYVGRIGKDTVKVIESIVKPYAVDVVTSAAFGGKVMESDGVDRRLEDLDMLETLTVADIETHRPDLLKAVRESALIEFKAQESTDDAVAAEKARADAAVAEAAAAKAELRGVRVAEATLAEVAKPEHKIPETARPLIVDRVKSRLGTVDIPTDKLSETVAGAVKEEVKLGQAFNAAKPAPVVPPNTNAQASGNARADLQKRMDKAIGVNRDKAGD